MFIDESGDIGTGSAFASKLCKIPSGMSTARRSRLFPLAFLASQAEKKPGSAGLFLLYAGKSRSTGKMRRGKAVLKIIFRRKGSF